MVTPHSTGFAGENERTVIFASAIVLLALASPARAHPHAFIEMTSDVVFDDAGLIKAINVEWVFDSDYSSMATEGLDTNKDGMLSTDELEPLAKENVDSLKEWSYFVYGRVNGEKLKWPTWPTMVS